MSVKVIILSLSARSLVTLKWHSHFAQRIYKLKGVGICFFLTIFIWLRRRKSAGTDMELQMFEYIVMFQEDQWQVYNLRKHRINLGRNSAFKSVNYTKGQRRGSQIIVTVICLEQPQQGRERNGIWGVYHVFPDFWLHIGFNIIWRLKF